MNILFREGGREGGKEGGGRRKMKTMRVRTRKREDRIFLPRPLEGKGKV